MILESKQIIYLPPLHSVAPGALESQTRRGGQGLGQARRPGRGRHLPPGQEREYLGFESIQTQFSLHWYLHHSSDWGSRASRVREGAQGVRLHQVQGHDCQLQRGHRSFQVFAG